MACIGKLTSDLLYDCANLGAVNGVGEIDEAIVVNSVDISSFSDAGDLSGTLVMQTGKKGYVVNSINNSVMYQDAIKVNDAAPAAEDQSVIIKMLANNITDAKEYRLALVNLLRGNYRVALKTKSGKYFLAGAFCGLEASDLVTDSSTGGISTVTLKTPDGSTGDMLVELTKANYDGLKTPKV